MRLFVLTFAVCVVSAGAIAAELPDCDKQTTAEPCICDLHTLRPLQGAIGKGEVEAKAQDIQEDLKHERKKLAKDPIKVVRGPDGLYITDHHHGALAWLTASTEPGICSVAVKKYPSDPAGYWKAIDSDH